MTRKRVDLAGSRTGELRCTLHNNEAAPSSVTCAVATHSGSPYVRPQLLESGRDQRSARAAATLEQDTELEITRNH
jgi:hypothetical protein